MRELPEHPHVVRMLGFDLDELTIYIEFCSGGSLVSYLAAHRTPIKKLLKVIIVQIISDFVVDMLVVVGFVMMD